MVEPIPKVTIHPPGTLRFLIDVLEEDDGRFSVWCANLPGIASFGDSKDEALHFISLAIQDVLISYHEAGEPIPWTEPEPPELGVRRFHLLLPAPGVSQ